MSSYRREVWATLAQLLQQVADQQETGAPAALTAIQAEMRKLGKTQFKANTLAEAQAAHWEKTLAALEKAQADNRQLQQARQNEQQQSDHHALLLALLPVLDDLEQALAAGQRQVDQLAEAAAIAGWLDGLRLIYDRLLAILARNGVAPIPTIGHPFDPYYHRAVGTTAQRPAAETAVAPGHIVGEERRGYQSERGVLRYADVIVYKPDTSHPT